MPEGPEIRRAADEIATVLVGKVIQRIEFGLPHLKHHEEILCGSTVLEIETRGKALLTHFDNGHSIYSHNQLYGRWYVVKRDKLPSTGRSLRLALHTKTHSALLYSASEIDVLDEEGINTHRFLTKLGPDILNPNLTWREIAARLAEPRFKKRSLAALYLDQSFLAGVGNYLRSEILFAAGTHPKKKPQELERKVINRLARSTLLICQRAYETGGITNPPQLAAKLKLSGLTRGQFRHGVFGRDNQACYGCGEVVLKEAISARRIYWCPLCQYE
ncbi:endonuclease VIII [Zhongshania sp.]|jgi:endonuclease-8|uniref:endonuclease VIII n=1 Tax=Zhongshania sp. TaxID=1971902 RepID=UPI0039E51BD0